MSCKRLSWLINWENMSATDRVLKGLPFVGPQARAYRDILKQLKQRSNSCLEEWQSFSGEERVLAETLSSIIQDVLGWPNRYFVPSDPFGILVWDVHGDLATEETLAQIERQTGVVKKTSDEWETLMQNTLGDVVKAICKETLLLS